MAHFFIDEGASAATMPPTAEATARTGGVRSLGLWGGRVGREMLVPQSEDDSIAYVAQDPFGRSNVPTWSSDGNGHLHGISIIGRREGTTDIVAKLPSNGSVWARIHVRVSGAGGGGGGHLTVRLHDRRLLGMLPRSNARQRTVETSEAISTGQTIRNVTAAARALQREPTGLPLQLEVYCHGLELRAVDRPMNRNADWLRQLFLAAFGANGQGGAGLVLGADLVTHRNVMSVGFGQWAGLFNLITLYACGPAYIEPGVVSGLASPGDGWALCKAIATQTRTPVRASSATQIYSIDLLSGELDFGDWEGSVYTIDP